jgi:hypothetical protein
MVTFVPPTQTAIQPTATAIQPAASTTPTGVPALARIYQEIDPALIYSSGWTNSSSVNTLGGGFKTTTRIGASVALDFSGRSFSLIYTTRNTFGKLEVYLDGQRIAVLDQKTSQVQYQRRWDYPGLLPAGTHQLKLVFTGPKRTKASLDAIIVW